MSTKMVSADHPTRVQVIRGLQAHLWRPENSADSTAHIISEFLQELNTPRTFVQDIELEEHVQEIISQWSFADRIKPKICLGLTLVECSYNHIKNIEARAAITLFTAILGYLDDVNVFNTEGASDFPRQLCTGALPQDSTIVRELHKILEKMWEFYPEFSATAIFYGTLQFLNGTMLESAPGEQVIDIRSMPFVELRRDMAGVPDPYISFIWEKSLFSDEKVYVQIIPEARKYINYINDIVSCYREELVGEIDNYIYSRAGITGKSVPATLKDVIREWLASRERIRELLPSGPTREAWDSFEQGFVSFHIVFPRYRLQDLLGGEYVAAGF